MKKERLIDILIIAIFLILLVVPSIIFSFVKDILPEYNSENRNFAEKPILSLETIQEYPKQFDDYYNDHLPFRAFLQRQYNNINFYILHSNSFNNVVIGKTTDNGKSRWLYYDKKSDGDPLRFATGAKQFTNDEKNAFAINIKQNTKKAEEKGIELYYFIALNKSTAYKELLPDTVKIKNNNNSVKELFEYVKNQNVDNIIYPYEELMEAKKTAYTFFISDTHWNDYGGFIGSKALHNRINKEYNYIFDNANIRVDGWHEFEGDLSKMLNISNSEPIKEPNIIIENFLDDKKVKGYQDNDLYVCTNDNPIIDKEVIIIGDSFSDSIINNFIKLYSKITYMPYYVYSEEVIDLLHPDILIVEAVERYIERMTNLVL